MAGGIRQAAIRPLWSKIALCRGCAAAATADDGGSAAAVCGQHQPTRKQEERTLSDEEHYRSMDLLGFHSRAALNLALGRWSLYHRSCCLTWPSQVVRRKWLCRNRQAIEIGAAAAVVVAAGAATDADEVAQLALLHLSIAGKAVTSVDNPAEISAIPKQRSELHQFRECRG